MSFTSDPQPFHRLYVGGRRSATNAVVARDTLDAAVPVASHPAGKPGLPPAAWPAPGDPCWELVTLTRDELAALANSLDGHVVFPGLHGYQDARSATEVHFPTPRVIAVCMTKRDVATCLQWITRHDWLLSIRSGGHNGAGFHLCNGLTLDLQNLDQMDYDVNCGEVTIGAGAKWKDIGAFLANKPGFLPGGTCGLVGAAGYTQGGGYSMVSRIFGLTCDLLVSAQVMLADGSEVTASAKENSDLFWALRGGGGGQFGVLLSMTFRLISPDQFFGFVLNWRLPDAAQALKHIEEHHTLNNRQSQSLGYLIAVTALTKDGDPSQVEDEASLSMLGIYRGTEDQARGHLAELLKIGPPKWRWSKYGRFNELNHEIFSVFPYTALSLRQAHKLEITGYVDTAVPDWAGLIELIGSGRTPNPGNLIGFEPYGGAIAAVSDGETAFPHRRQKLNIKINSYWSDVWKYNHTRASAQQWLDLVSAIISPALNGRTYVNYMREDIRDYRSAYWAQNFEKLLEIKTKLDPGQLFRFEQSIRKR